MSARICTRSFASRFESGSSIRKTCGWRTIARPIATRCRWPPESCLRPPVEVRRQVEHLRRPGDALVDELALRSLRRRRPKAMFSATRQVRVERVVLEDHRDVALLRRQVVDDAAADRDRAVGDLLEPRDHAQRGRLAAARRADEDEELAVADVEREVVDGLDAVVVDLVDVCRRRHQPRGLVPFARRQVSQPPDVEGRAVRRAARPRRLAARVARRRAVSSSEQPSGASGSRTGSWSPRLARQSSRSPVVSRRYAIASVADVGVADPAARRARRSSGAGAISRRSSSRSVVSQALGAAPRHRPAGVLAPVALEPELVAGEDHRHARRRHLQADARRAGARASRRSCGSAAVSWLSSSVQEWSTRLPGHAGAERAHRGDGGRARQARQADRDAPERAAQLLRQRRRRGATSRRAAGSRRSSSSPCQPSPPRSRRKSWPCSATRRPSGRAASTRRVPPSRGRRSVSRASRKRPVMFATSMRQPSSSYGGSSQRRTTARHPRAQLRRAPVELRQARDRRATTRSRSGATRRSSRARARARPRRPAPPGTTRGREPLWFSVRSPTTRIPRCVRGRASATRAPRRRRAAGRRGSNDVAS